MDCFYGLSFCRFYDQSFTLEIKSDVHISNLNTFIHTHPGIRIIGLLLKLLSHLPRVLRPDLVAHPIGLLESLLLSQGSHPLLENHISLKILMMRPMC